MEIATYGRILLVGVLQILSGLFLELGCISLELRWLLELVKIWLFFCFCLLESGAWSAF